MTTAKKKIGDVHAAKAVEAAKAFIVDLVRLKARAGELRLYKTMQALEAPIQAVGWEVADLVGTTPEYRKKLLTSANMSDSIGLKDMADQLRREAVDSETAQDRRFGAGSR